MINIFPKFFFYFLLKICVIAIKKNESDPLLLKKILERINNLLGKGFAGKDSLETEVNYVKKYLDINKKLLILDIGANKGKYSDFLIKELKSYKLILFEPNKENYNFLVKKFKDSNDIILENLGLSNQSNKTKLFTDKLGSGLASLNKRNLSHFNKSFDVEEEIEVVKLKDYWLKNIKNQYIDLLKLDIEGHELSALEGCEDMIRYIKLIQFEFGGCNIDSKTYFQNFWYFFQEINFEIYRMSPVKLIKINFYSELDEFFTTTNYLAVNRNLIT